MHVPTATPHGFACLTITQAGSSKLFTWKVVKFVKSNAIVYCRDGMTIGIGAGQMSRVYSAKIAGIKARDEGLEVRGSVLASDAFFPFRDGIDAAAEAGVSAVIRSRVLKSWGESESRLAELLAERIEALDRAGNPTIAFQASGIEGLKIRITAKAGSEAGAQALIAGEEAKVRAIVGDAIFGTDTQTMESTVLDLLRARGLSLAVAESVTGGLIGARLTAVPGASDVFRGAVVSYASAVKFDVLGVPEGPVVSTDAARAMALGVRERLGADVGLATTGVAGPAEQEGHPPGTVFLGLAHGDQAEALRVRLPGDRRRVREYAVISGLNLLRLRISGSARSPELR